jgi:uridine kinase
LPDDASSPTLIRMARTSELKDVTRTVLSTPIRNGRKARLIAISGIDSSGKGYIASRLSQCLSSTGARVALLGIDGWLNLPYVRFSVNDAGRHFYRNAFRFEEMFSQLVDPLVSDGSIDVLTDFTEETAHEYRKQRYTFADVDTILLEGVLLRRDLRSRYDLRVWIDCSFETALQRAVARAQEGLGPDDTAAAFQTIYFPAQQVHFLEDNPIAYADLTFENDGAHL